MVRKKRIKEFDEFDWVKDINAEYNIENIISKKIHWRHNNLGELESLGHDLTTIDKSKVILGKIPSNKLKVVTVKHASDEQKAFFNYWTGIEFPTSDN